MIRLSTIPRRSLRCDQCSYVLTFPVPGLHLPDLLALELTWYLPRYAALPNLL